MTTPGPEASKGRVDRAREGTDVHARPGDADAATEHPGASAPEPSLVARLARAGAAEALPDGDSTPAVDRVDAAGATLGSHRDTGDARAAEGGIASVGGALGDVPGDAVADEPEEHSPADPGAPPAGSHPGRPLP